MILALLSSLDGPGHDNCCRCGSGVETAIQKCLAWSVKLKKAISLRWFLSLNLGLALVVQCVVVAVLAWHILLPRMRTDIGFHQHALAHAVAGDVSTHVLGGERQLRALAEFIWTHPDFPDIPWNDLLDAQCGDGDVFEAIYITDSRDKAIQAIGLAHGLRAKRRELMGLALSEAGILPPTAQSPGMTSWSDPFSSTASGRMAVAVTITLGKQVIGGVITIDRLSESIRDLSAGSDVQILILDRQGIIIADSKEIWRGEPFDARHFSEARGLRDAPRIPTAFKLHGRALVGTLTAIDPIGWKVVVAQHSRAAYQPIWSTFVTLVLGLIIAVLLALIFAWLQSNKLVRLFNIYSDQARAISQGHYDVRRPAARTKEFSQLAETMQQMAQMIRQREQRIVDSESNLKITLDSIGDAVVATDDQGRVARMNPSAEHLAGRSLAEAAGKPLTAIFSLIDGHSRQQTADPLAPVLAHGQTVALGNDTLLLSSNGGERRVAVSVAPIRSLEERIVGAVMVLRDVSEIYTKEQKPPGARSLKTAAIKGRCAVSIWPKSAAWSPATAVRFLPCCTPGPNTSIPAGSSARGPCSWISPAASAPSRRASGWPRPCCKPRKWKPSAPWPAALPMTSTTFYPP
jgi:PAS domain S-box-containing protein